ncbi:hypothetical protein MRS44_002705 [Fusarium solani]|uniref:Rab-GAP TBC domain-containing protein n=1 Tax=Fusarium solani TaxID=169388 RepID=A0A9P9RAB0_FUSSL|nr:uncharacterized protein B0J15DRAFT_169843 [Fusarium solani]KAH7272196.1 hypothetical protein B0J15DRAFT_169843 [Fusarium solani]KAJ3468640.1 hypothetical protein MRS44_002705 [Fusarium solani]
MLPPKFGNARYPTERRASLRYDASLVGMRYEKTVPAEPPIPIISRNPARPSRRPSSSSASSHSSFHSSYHRPVVVPPPGSIAPPTEEHPALRGTASSSPSPRTSPVSASEEWKRDSGVARANSTSTIHEEEDEDDFADSLCEQACGSIAVVPSSVSSLAASVVSRPSTTVRHMDDPFVDQNSITAPLESVSSAASSVVSNAGCTTPPPPPPASHSHPATPTRASRALPIPIPFSKSAKIPSSPSCPAPAATSSSYPPAPPPPSTSSSPRSSFSTSPRKFVKSLSLRSGQRLGKKSLSQMLSTPMQPLWRGSSTPASSTSSDSSTPTGTTTSTAAAAPGTTASATANATATATAMAGPKQAPSWSPKGSSRFWHRSRSSTNSTTTSAGTISSDCDLPFLPLDVSIPCDSLLDDGFMNSVTFSNRGSIMFGAQDIIALDGAADQDNKSLDPSPATTKTAIDNDGRATPTTPTAPSLTSPTTPTRVATPTTPVSQSLPRPSDESNDMNKSDRRGSPQGQMSPPDIRVLAADVEKESQKVRSLYTVGDGSRGEPGKRRSYCERLEPTPEVPSEENELDPVRGRLSPAWQMPASGSTFSPRFETPGGLEDWDDLEGAHVDRYGFITVPPPRIGTPTETRSASGSPRRRNVLLKRDAYGISSTLSGRRTPTRKVSARSLNTQTSELSLSTSLRSSRSVIRQASNLLPHNRDRRWMDEAGDMLNQAPSLQDIVDEIQAEKLTEVMKRKEWERSEKWRKMAKVVRKGSEGQGMEFEFDSKNPKLIERTWKGIPDRWRGAAWWSFMATSAREHRDSTAEDRIVAEFHRLQLRSSPDDVQIDLDVPRTISRHIMFRRRYRGGQRLLFRVLHAISIYFPETGYVQGMASLAATLLCYFDEEKCFVMLVRMWQLRGLARLYRPGFEELMAAMSDFSTNWLNKEVASKLVELCIDTTAYGTRWYLTLFNLSVPFPAQLRVWDVFLLLGDDTSASSDSTAPRKPGTNPPSSGEYDVLHATSAALAQALREVLLDAEFENAMKALTSSIPIKDEDLLMKVVKAEYKQHHGKKKA